MSKSLHPISTYSFLERLFDGVSLLYDASREAGAPKDFVLSLSDAMASLQSCMRVCKLHISD